MISQHFQQNNLSFFRLLVHFSDSAPKIRQKKNISLRKINAYVSLLPKEMFFLIFMN